MEQGAVSKKPIKSPGGWYDSNLKYTDYAGPKNNDRSMLSGRLKTLCLQFGLLPHLMWPLTMYGISLTRESEKKQKKQWAFMWESGVRILQSKVQDEPCRVNGYCRPSYSPKDSREEMVSKECPADKMCPPPRWHHEPCPAWKSQFRTWREAIFLEQGVFWWVAAASRGRGLAIGSVKLI